MLADAHREKALRIEQSIADFGDPALKPYIAEALIELSWAAAFQWIAAGSQQKHGKHKENHTHLVSCLNDKRHWRTGNLASVGCIVGIQPHINS